MIIDFKSENIAKFEKTSGKNIYSICGYSVSLAGEFLKVATGVFEEEKETEIYAFLDTLKKEKGNINAVVDYLIDTCDEEGFFTYLTGAEVKEILRKQEEKLKMDSLMSEEDKRKQVEKLIAEGLKKLQDSGIKNGKK